MRKQKKRSGKKFQDTKVFTKFPRLGMFEAWKESIFAPTERSIKLNQSRRNALESLADIGRAMDDYVGMNYTSDLRDELIKMVNSEEKKRTISLEAYLKMQNDWVLATYEKVDGGNFSVHEHLGKNVVDALLKHNNVVVEGE